MIDSVLGIYTTLGSITNLDLSRNRLESLCGLERLGALERVDIRTNYVEESAEVGRLVALPNISNISVEGNPFAENEDEYRARCFEYFLKEGKSITLDGTLPTFYDRRSIAVTAPEPPPIEPAPAPSPNVVAVAAPRPLPAPTKASPSPKLAPTPSPAPVLTAAAVSPKPKPVIHHQVKPRKRKPTRIVELDDHSGESRDHSRAASVDMLSSSPGQMPSALSSSPGQVPSLMSSSPSNPGRGRHQRTPVHTLPSPIREDTEPLASPVPPPSRPSGHRRQTSGSSLGGKGPSKSARRRGRASASVYEPAGEPPQQQSSTVDDAEAFRRKMEALRAEVGDSWLKVLSQQQQAGGVKS
ncbi:hypothetical protein FRC12_011745 [Ceratobasidium sp. 428]|nr:hypothetical protein FRC12_011745 [Ceratobasidium sp. 428]